MKNFLKICNHFILFILRVVFYKFIHTYEGKGTIIFKVTVEMKELETWLKDKGLLNTGENRQEYVNYRMREFLKNAII
jgi:hypothetical protein